MTIGSIIISVIIGFLYGWASAYWSGANKLLAPQILHSQFVNLLISVGTLATIILSGVSTHSIMGSVYSFIIILIFGFVTNMRINNNIQKRIHSNQSRDWDDLD